MKKVFIEWLKAFALALGGVVRQWYQHFLSVFVTSFFIKYF